jgi:hypothetical protein
VLSRPAQILSHIGAPPIFKSWDEFEFIFKTNIDIFPLYNVLVIKIKFFAIFLPQNCLNCVINNSKELELSFLKEQKKDIIVFRRHILQIIG